MKLYDFSAPNPQKVRIYAAEKNISLECVQVAVLENELHTPAMLAKNPLAQVPFLELEDGTIIRESLAIVEYLEAYNPDPPMFGTNPLERARIQELDRLAELGILSEAANYLHQTNPYFAPLGPQSPEGAQMANNILIKRLEVMDAEIGTNEFVAGKQLSIADITLYCALGFIVKLGPGLPDGLDNIVRWQNSFAKRPSASA